MTEWTLRTKDGKVIEGEGSPFAVVSVNDISEFFFMPKNIGVVLKKGQRLIYFKRHKMEIKANSSEIANHTISYWIGFQETKNGRNFKCLIEIQPDGHLILRDDDGRND